MKKILLILLLITFSSAFAYAEYFYIKNYDTKFYIQKNSEIEVEENILVHFTSPRHGIFREIPYSYQVKKKDEDLERAFIFGNTYKIKIYDIKVENFKTKIYKKNGKIIIRIGSKNKFVSGDVLYKISYKVYGAINFFKDHSEFYYNVIGFQWPVKIEKASFEIFFPYEYKPEKDKFFVYSGRYGSKKSNISVNVDNGNIYGETLSPLPPKNGITVGIWFPKGIITKGSIFTQIKLIIYNNAIYLLPIFVFIIMFVLWFLFGKDEDIIKIVQYKLPDYITPAEAGVIIDDKTDNRDILSLIYYWAANGYLEIEETEGDGLIFKKKDYILNKLKDLPEDAKSYEKTIFNGLFPGTTKSVKISTLKNNFYTYISQAKDQLEAELTIQDYYNPTSQYLAKLSYLAAVLFLFLGVFLGPFFGRFDYTIAFIISAVITFIFARIMPKKTDKGTKVYQLVEGFKQFIERVEKPRLKLMLKEDPNYFDKILPYAVALGIEDKVAEKFEDLLTEPPRWYKSRDGYYRHGHFSTIYFMSGLNHSLKSMNTALTSMLEKSASSGSGFSGGIGGGGFGGGGFGGGGGGSW